MKFRFIALAVCSVAVLSACNPKTEPSSQTAEAKKSAAEIQSWIPCHKDMNEVWDKGLDAKCDDQKPGSQK